MSLHFWLLEDLAGSHSCQQTRSRTTLQVMSSVFLPNFVIFINHNCLAGSVPDGELSGRGSGVLPVGPVAALARAPALHVLSAAGARGQAALLLSAVSTLAGRTIVVPIDIH